MVSPTNIFLAIKMEIRSFNLTGILQFPRWLSILWHCAPSSPLSCDAVIVLNKKKEMHIALKTCCIYSVIVTLNGLISPGVEGKGMGQDLKFSSLKCCCLKMRKPHLFIVSVTWGVFTKMSSHTSPFSGRKHSKLSAITPSVANMAAVCEGPSRALTTVSLLPVLASMCVCVCVCLNERLFCVWPLQPAAC